MILEGRICPCLSLKIRRTNREFLFGTKKAFHSSVLLEYVTNANFGVDKRKAEAMLSRCYLIKDAPQWRSHHAFFFFSLFKTQHCSSKSFTFICTCFLNFNVSSYFDLTWQDRVGDDVAQGSQI